MIIDALYDSLTKETVHKNSEQKSKIILFKHSSVNDAAITCYDEIHNAYNRYFRDVSFVDVSSVNDGIMAINEMFGINVFCAVNAVLLLGYKQGIKLDFENISVLRQMLGSSSAFNIALVVDESVDNKDPELAAFVKALSDDGRGCSVGIISQTQRNKRNIADAVASYSVNTNVDYSSSFFSIRQKLEKNYSSFVDNNQDKAMHWNTRYVTVSNAEYDLCIYVINRLMKNCRSINDDEIANYFSNVEKEIEQEHYSSNVTTRVYREALYNMPQIYNADSNKLSTSFENYIERLYGVRAEQNFKISMIASAGHLRLEDFIKTDDIFTAMIKKFSMYNFANCSLLKKSILAGLETQIDRVKASLKKIKTEKENLLMNTVVADTLRDALNEYVEIFKRQEFADSIMKLWNGVKERLEKISDSKFEKLCTCEEYESVANEVRIISNQHDTNYFKNITPAFENYLSREVTKDMILAIDSDSKLIELMHSYIKGEDFDSDGETVDTRNQLYFKTVFAYEFNYVCTEFSSIQNNDTPRWIFKIYEAIATHWGV